VTLRLKQRAATEYGYINPGGWYAATLSSLQSSSRSPIKQKAAEYIKTGFLCNSPNFMFRSSVLLNEYGNFDAACVDVVSLGPV